MTFRTEHAVSRWNLGRSTFALRRSDSAEGTSAGRIARRRAKVFLPKFRLDTAMLRPKSPPLIFFNVKMTCILEEGHRRWPEEGTTH